MSNLTILSFSASNSASVANVASFVFNSEFLTRLEASDSLSNFLFYVCVNYIVPKFIRINSSEIFSFDICYFSVLIEFFLAKLVTLGILLSTSSNFGIKQ